MNGLWLLRILGAYVHLQFSWWAYLLVNTGGPEAKWMVLGEGTVFATLLLVGLFRLERNLKRERDRLKRERPLRRGVTHELKTPLASVQLGVDSLRRLALSDEDRKGVLDNMQMGVTHLGRMVEDMLVATRLQHQTALQEVDFSWGDMAEDAVERAGAADLDNITLIRNTVDQDDMVKGDKALWTLAASNLLENALKYGEDASRSTQRSKEAKRCFRWRMKVKASRPKTKRWPWRHLFACGKKNQALDWASTLWVKQPHCTGLRWPWNHRPQGLCGSGVVGSAALSLPLHLRREDGANHTRRLGTGVPTATTRLKWHTRPLWIA